MTATPADLVGQRVGPYRLERLLGQGGFAWVFAGRDADGTPCAVKLLKPRYAGDAHFEARFRNEAETAAKLQAPNIIRIRAVARSGEQVYFAMDLCADSLGARIARDGPLPEAEIARLGRDVARGLAFAHAQGVIHRDLKPDNILIHSDGSAVISDFGIARAISGYVASTGVNMTIGTPQYLSPEQAQGRPLDARVDFYALGVTLFKAATGDVPFASTDWFELARMHVEDPPPLLRKQRPELSKRFERVVSKCLAKHPDDRYRDATELLVDLEALTADGRASGTAATPAAPGAGSATARATPTALADPAGPAGPAARAPRWALVAAAVGACLLLGALVALLVRRVR
jgi:eukaryotic-like serine/threonine-protein kinase